MERGILKYKHAVIKRFDILIPLSQTICTKGIRIEPGLIYRNLFLLFFTAYQIAGLIKMSRQKQIPFLEAVTLATGSCDVFILHWSFIKLFQCSTHQIDFQTLELGVIRPYNLDVLYIILISNKPFHILTLIKIEFQITYYWCTNCRFTVLNKIIF